MLEKIEGLIKKWTIQRNWQHMVQKREKKQKTKNTNTTQYVLDTSIFKQTQII